MSKIKVLFAEVNGDDDLTVDGKKGIEGEHLKTIEQFKDAVANHFEQKEVIATTKRFFNSNYEVGDDNGHLTITNFPNMCSQLATAVMETMIIVYRADLSDAVYNELEAWVTNFLCLKFDNYISELAKDLEEA